MSRSFFLCVLLCVWAGCSGEDLPASSVDPTLGASRSALTATYSSTLRVPYCSSLTNSCASGTLLNGRGSVGPELNAPNTLRDSCLDGNAGTYPSSESLESLTVETLDGTQMATNKPVRITALINVSSAYWDGLDLYYTADANNPSWSYLTTLYASGTGTRLVSTTYTLPTGSLQAIRGRFSYRSTEPSPCTSNTGSYTDHDDLAFTVAAAPADTTPPTVILTSPQTNSVVPQAISLTVTATDNVGVSRVEFFGDGVLVATDTSAPYAFVWNTSPGAHVVYAKAYDAKGNVATSSSASVTANIAPSVWFISPEPNSFFTGTYHVVAGASDDVAVTKVQFLLGTSVQATDTSAPFEADLSESGVHTVIARAFDAAGNTTDATLTVRNDVRPPQIAITSPGAYAMVSGIVNFSANTLDDVETQRVEFFADGAPVGVDSSTPFSLPWDTLPLQNGPQTKVVQLRARAYDLAGRFTDSTTSVYVFNDTTPPTVTLTAPTEGVVVSGMLSLSATATDDVSVSAVNFRVEGASYNQSDFSTPYQGLLDTRVLPNGPHTLKATARDGHGNESTHSVQVIVDNDVIAPVVALTAPASGAIVEGTVTVSADATDDRAVTKVDFLLNGVPLGTVTAAPWSIAWNTRASMTNGTKTLTAKAFDAVGNVTTSAVRTVTVNNDWVSPTVNITSPANGSTISGQTQVAVTATDNRAVTRVELLVDWVQVQTQTTAPYVFTLDGTTLAPGVHGLSARAFDAAGQSWMQSVNVTVQIDSTPPEVTLTAPAPAATLASEVLLSATATDNVGVQRVEFLVDGLVVGTDASSPYEFIWATSSVPNGPHSLSVRAWDTSQLSSTTPAMSVTVSNTSPADLEAQFDALLGAPACATAAAWCDSGTLLNGRGPLGPEVNEPNNLGAACADGTGGIYLADESVESIRVETQDGTTLAEEKDVLISVEVFAWGPGDHLDIYHSADVSNPTWTLLSTVDTATPGRQTHSIPLALPSGSRQVVRAVFRYDGTSGTCVLDSYNESDDLVFAVAP